VGGIVVVLVGDSVVGVSVEFDVGSADGFSVRFVIVGRPVASGILTEVGCVLGDVGAIEGLSLGFMVKRSAVGSAVESKIVGDRVVGEAVGPKIILAVGDTVG
jgi:hypothetical protein